MYEGNQPRHPRTVETVRTSELEAADPEFISRAANFLESPSFFIRLADLVGMPLEEAVRL